MNLHNFIFFYVIRKKLFKSDLLSGLYLKNNKKFIVKCKEGSIKVIRKISFYKNNINKLVSFFNKKGLLLNKLICLMKVYSIIYNIFLNFEPSSILQPKSYNYISEFSYCLLNIRGVLNIKELLNWVVS